MGGRLFSYGFLVSTLMACASGGGKGGTGVAGTSGSAGTGSAGASGNGGASACQPSQQFFVDQIWPNCPRYVHRSNGRELSANVPAADGSAPIAEWKCMPVFNEVLAADDPART